MTTITPDEAVRMGFAKFNRGQHLAVDVPDGNFTVTCRTSEGRKLTVAFCPYKDGGPAQCVDIQHHTSELTVPNGEIRLPVQQVICFGIGRDKYRSQAVADKEKATTLTTILLTPIAEGALSVVSVALDKPRLTS